MNRLDSRKGRLEARQRVFRVLRCLVAQEPTNALYGHSCESAGLSGEEGNIPVRPQSRRSRRISANVASAS
jgi:hypothetical protein